ncbi:MAG: hypothetical protein AB1498_01365 [bacterium]
MKTDIDAYRDGEDVYRGGVKSDSEKEKQDIKKLLSEHRKKWGI